MEAWYAFTECMVRVVTVVVGTGVVQLHNGKAVFEDVVEIAVGVSELYPLLQNLDQADEDTAHRNVSCTHPVDAAFCHYSVRCRQIESDAAPLLDLTRRHVSSLSG